MTINERRPLKPWFRVLIGVIGLAVAGLGALLVVAGLSDGRPDAGDLMVLTVFGLYAAAGLLLLVVGIAGRTPSWLAVHEPGLGRNMLFGISFVAAFMIFDALKGWLRTHLGMSGGASRLLSMAVVAVLLLGFAVLQGLADRAKRRRAGSTRPVA